MLKRYVLIVLFSAVSLVLPALSAFACDYCILSTGISPLDNIKGSGVRINSRYTLMDKTYKGTEEIKTAGRPKEEFWTTEITGFFGVTEDITLLGVVPLKKNKARGHLHVHEDGEIEVEGIKGNESGLGDIAVLGRFSMLRRHTLDSTTVVAVLAGVKLPTGSTDGRTEAGDEYLDAHMQLGTGSTDLLLGLSASHAVQRLTLMANLLGAVTTQGTSGEQEHQYGNVLNYDMGAKYRVYPGQIAPAGTQLFLAMSVNGEVRERETNKGVEDKNSGGHTAYLSPGLQLVLAQRWVIEASYSQAVYHNLYGAQTGERFKTNAGVTYLF